MGSKPEAITERLTGHAQELKREEFAKRMAECDARQAELKKKCKVGGGIQ